MSKERLRGERDRSIRTASRLAMDVAERDSLIVEYKAEIERLRLCKAGYTAADCFLIDAEIARLKAVLRDVISALDTLGIDGWSEAPHLMRVCRAALEGKT